VLLNWGLLLGQALLLLAWFWLLLGWDRRGGLAPAWASLQGIRSLGASNIIIAPLEL
jgi:hypothetical protein